MIRRLYVDNFRCLQDFEWEPGAETLVLGYNGSGKTTAMDALVGIRAWISGLDRIQEVIFPQALTRWSNSETVKFELDIETEEGLLRYSVEIECRLHRPEAIVRTEALSVDKRAVFVRNGLAVTVHDGEKESVASFSLVSGQSALPTVAASEHHKFSRLMLSALSRMILTQPMPPLMKGESEGPDPHAAYRFDNFVAWYQNWAQQERFSRSWIGLLNDVWPEFDYLQFERLGRDETGLNVVFKNPTLATGEFKLEFQELSEGEKMLVVLYALLAYQASGPPTTIFIDEPDNFVALSELQPWLLRMMDDRPDKGQIIMVSHNPEIIRTFGFENAHLFERKDHRSPTTVRKVEPDDTGLGLDELLRLGWLPKRTAEDE